MSKSATVPPRGRIRALAVVAPLAIAAAGCFGVPPAPSGGPAPSSGGAGAVGLNTYLFWNSEADARAQLRSLEATGVRWVRENFPWEEIEPVRGGFQWSRADALMAAAAVARVDVLPILAYSPAWASSDPSGGGNKHYPPASAADYANFAGAVVQRYGPGGAFWASRPDLVARPLNAVELWNEPWGYWFWKPNPNPAGYAALVRAAGGAVRQTDPSVQLVVSGDIHQVRADGAPATWLASLLAADPGLGAYVDVWAVHPYPDPFGASPDATGSWSYKRVTTTRDVAASSGVSRPVWITEIGWSTATGHPDGISESVQAWYTARALDMALVDWSGFVGRTFVYSWFPDSGDPADLQGNFGLLRADGSTKPAWTIVDSHAN